MIKGMMSPPPATPDMFANRIKRNTEIMPPTSSP